MIKYYCEFCRTIVNEPSTCTKCGKVQFIPIEFTVHQQSTKIFSETIESNINKLD